MAVPSTPMIAVREIRCMAELISGQMERLDGWVEYAGSSHARDALGRYRELHERVLRCIHEERERDTPWEDATVACRP